MCPLLHGGFQMMGECVQYLGRQVSKDGFRVFVYDLDGQKKIVNSWEEFEQHMATGIWFAALADIKSKDEEPVLAKSRKKGYD